MAITIERKNELKKKFGKNEQDSGTTEVQIAILSDRIAYLTDHFKTHSKDHHSRRSFENCWTASSFIGLPV